MSIEKFNKVKLRMEIIDDNQDVISSKIIDLTDIAISRMFNPEYITEEYRKLVSDAKEKLVSIEEQLELAIGAINIKELKSAEDKNLFVIDHIKKYQGLDVTAQCALDFEYNIFSGAVIFGKNKVYAFTHTF
jgi:hypothetical protein